MFISPKVAINEGWITYRDLDDNIEAWEANKFISPNAIDFPLSTVYTIASDNAFIVAEEGKMMRGGVVHSPVVDRQTEKEYWNLAANSVYDCLSDMYVRIPDGVACQLIIRSTLSRNGLFITSGLYDQGYQGSIGFALHNRCGLAKIGVDTRVGQIIFTEAQTSGKLYEGGYNHAAGTLAHQEEN